MSELSMALLGRMVNIEAEQSLLGALLYEPELIGDCILKPDHFGEEKHVNLFHVIRDLDEKQIPIDIVAIVERVGNNKIDKVGGVSYLSDLAASIPTTANFKYYEGVVLEYYQKRRAHDIGKKIMQDINEHEPGQVVQEAIENLVSIDEDTSDDDDGRINDGLIKLYDWMEQDHGDITGSPTGYTELDNMTSGLQRQDLIIIGARPSVGKTAFALNVGLNIAEKGQNDAVGIFSLEMPEDALLKRMISNMANIDAGKMKNPIKKFENEDWGKNTMAMGKLGGIPLHVFDKSGIDVAYIRKKCRLMRKLYPQENVVIIVDYLQLILGNPKHGGNRQAEIAEISRMLKHIARELDITIIALSQLSRGVESRQDKRPMMSDLRESGQIEQDADVIAFLYRDDYYDKESEKQNIIEIIVAKQRNGPTGTVELAFIKEFNKFVNLDHRYSE